MIIKIFFGTTSYHKEKNNCIKRFENFKVKLGFKKFIEFLGYAKYMLNKQWKNNEHEMELSMEGISVKEPKTCKTPSPLTMKYDFEFSHFVI